MNWQVVFPLLLAGLAPALPAQAGPKAGQVLTVAGSAGVQGSNDGLGPAARFSWPAGIALDAMGDLYVADPGDDTIRKISPEKTVTTLAGSADDYGDTDGAGRAARFNGPFGVAVDNSGNVYIAETFNQTIRKISPAGVAITWAGSPGSRGAADGVGRAARFNWPSGVAVDRSGSVYVADNGNDSIRKISPAGRVTTLAGKANHPGMADGIGATARFFHPYAIAVDASGQVYVADTFNHTIRKVAVDGTVTTLAGSPGQHGSADGTGRAARFYSPTGIAVDTSGNVYVADSFNNTLRQITPTGMVTTLAGMEKKAGCVDGPGTAARFAWPTGIAATPEGVLYIADSHNYLIREYR